MSHAEIIKRWFDEVWGPARSEATIDELMPDHSRVFGLEADKPVDRDAFKQLWRNFTQAFPEMTVELIECLVSGDQAAYRAVAKNQTPDNAFSFQGNGIVTINNGQIVESHETWDFHGMLTQLKANDTDVLAKTLVACASSHSG